MRKIYQFSSPHLVALIIYLTLFACSSCSQYSLTKWQYQIVGESSIKKQTQIPTSLAQILTEDGIIDDPYYRDNFLKYYDYQTKDILFQTTIQESIVKQCAAKKVKRLIFQGLDTHCDVKLNDKLILTAHNMYRQYQVAVNFSTTAANKLSVRCNSSANFDIEQQDLFKKQFGFQLPQNFSFTRKAAYQYGWDWGPRILTVGIWKYIKLNCFDGVTIKRIGIDHSPIIYSNLAVSNITVTADLTDTTPSGTYSADVIIQKYGKQVYNKTEKFKVSAGKHRFTSAKFSLTKSEAQNLIWWTWDIGQPNLFNLTVKVNNQSMTIQTGFRTVKIIQTKGVSDKGTSFTINLNGYDVFMRGGNWIPPSMLMTNKTQLSISYQRLKRDTLFAKYNMIRIWGGGQFESQQFYQAMDQSGILIWHDLMFACALYPIFGNISTTQNIEAEIQDNIGRIGHHPSIGLWNGNNQVWIGWQQWGWKNNLTATQITQAETMYKKIFHETIPKAISDLTPNIFYWETSPSSSSNSLDTISSGDIHFWRVWGGGTPIQQYESFIGRFNSEYGMQSMPEYSSIIRFTDENDRKIGSLILSLHQRHPRGDQYLPMYTQNACGKTNNLKKYSYYTQIMQSYALQMAIRTLRGSKPFCMGSLYWQLNDVWPVASWSTVDYYGSYKAAHYRIRQLHNQLLGHVIYSTVYKTYKIFIVNDYVDKLNISCYVTFLDFNGSEIQKVNYLVNSDGLDKVVVAQYPQIYFDGIDLKRTLINVKVTSNSSKNSQNNYFFTKMKDRQIIFPDLSYKTIGTTLILKTKFLANYVWIRSKSDNYLHLSQNYFDLLPDQEKIISLPSGTDPESIQVTCYQSEVIQQGQKSMGIIAQLQEENLRHYYQAKLM